MRKYLLSKLHLCVLGWMLVQSTQLEAQTRLLIRCDDVGMCHTVNQAAKILIETGMTFSSSIKRANL